MVFSVFTHMHTELPVENCLKLIGCMLTPLGHDEGDIVKIYVMYAEQTDISLMFNSDINDNWAWAHI